MISYQIFTALITPFIPTRPQSLFEDSHDLEKFDESHADRTPDEFLNNELTNEQFKINSFLKTQEHFHDESLERLGLQQNNISLLDSFTPIDTGALIKLIKSQEQAGITGVIVNGTTGENALLTEIEKKLIIETSLNARKSSEFKIISGVSEISTHYAAQFIKWLNTMPIDGIMLPTPAQVKPNTQGLENHFLKLADISTKPIMIYNNPGRSVKGLSAKSIARLAQHPNIHSIKESSGNCLFIQEIQQELKRPEWEVHSLNIFCGDDHQILPYLVTGSTGAISVVSNLIPKTMVHLMNLIQANCWKEAIVLSQNLYPLFRDLSIDTNPIPIKSALHWQGVCSDKVRQPLSRLTFENQEQLHKTLTRIFQSNIISAEKVVGN